MRYLIFASAIICFTPLKSLSQEHPGEHPGVIERIRPQDVKDAIRDYIKGDMKLKGGYFLIWDSKLSKVWRLNFSKLHKEVRVLKDGTYFMCTDFKDVVKGTVLDIDFWLREDEETGELNVVDIKIHKVGGKPRFTYEGEEIRELK